MEDETILSSATFIISGNNLDPDQISDWIGLQPDQSWKVGDSITYKSGRTHVYSNAAWKLFQTKTIDKYSLDAQLSYWERLLADKALIMSQIRTKGLEVELNCFVSFDTIFSVHFSTELFNQLNNLGVDISFDCFVHQSDPISDTDLHGLEELPKMSNNDVNAFHNSEETREYSASTKLLIRNTNNTPAQANQVLSDLSLNERAISVTLKEETNDRSVSTKYELDLNSDIKNLDVEDQLYYWLGFLSSSNLVKGPLKDWSNSINLECNVRTDATVSLYWKHDLIKDLSNLNIGLNLNLIKRI